MTPNKSAEEGFYIDYFHGIKECSSYTSGRLHVVEYSALLAEQQKVAALTAKLERMTEALKKIDLLLSACRQTGFPINVRELDGSISQHRPKTNEGIAYDIARAALADGEGEK